MRADNDSAKSNENRLVTLEEKVTSMEYRQKELHTRPVTLPLCHKEASNRTQAVNKTHITLKAIDVRRDRIVETSAETHLVNRRALRPGPL